MLDLTPRSTLDLTPRSTRGIQFFIERSLQPAVTHGQHIQARLGHRAASQGVDDLGSALRTDHL